MATKREDLPLHELKLRRSVAQSQFSRKAHLFATEAKNLSASALVNRWKDFKEEFINVGNAGSDYAEAIRESEEEEAEKKAEEIEKKTEACHDKLLAVKVVVQEILSPIARGEIYTLTKESDLAISRAEDIDVKQMTSEECDLLIKNLEEEILAVEEVAKKWSEMITIPEELDLNERIRLLRKRNKALVNRMTAHKDGESKTIPPVVKRKLKVEHIEKPNEEEDEIGPSATSSGSDTQFKSQLSLERARLPMFTGNIRDYYSWREKWESLQHLGNPSGLDSVKELHLLNSLTENVKSKLVLSRCKSSDDILKCLDLKYGHKAVIATLIVEEIQRLPKVKDGDPRGLLELLQEIERALKELQTLEDTSTLENPLVATSIERKLPLSLRQQWADFKAETDLSPRDTFKRLLEFLRKKEAGLQTLLAIDQDDDSASGRHGSGTKVKANTRSMSKDILKRSSVRTDYAPILQGSSVRKDNATQRNGPCTTCGDVGHEGRLFACKLFKKLSLPDKKAHLQKAGACFTCLRTHGTDEGCTRKFLCTKEECRNKGTSDHNYLLCSRPSKKKDDKHLLSNLLPIINDLQNKFCNELQNKIKEACTPELAEACTMTTFRTKPDLSEYPMLMMLVEATTATGKRVGAFFDTGSDTNYITFEAAQRLNLQGEDIKLLICGVERMTETIATKRYTLELNVKNSKGKVVKHELLCYGLNWIAGVTKTIHPEQLKKFFPEVALQDLGRPDKVDLLIGIGETCLVPNLVKIVEGLALFDGPLGVIVAGAHPDLVERVNLEVHNAGTHFVRSMRSALSSYKEVLVDSVRLSPVDGTPAGENGGEGEKILKRNIATSTKDVLEWFKWDSIGAACLPRCGGCKCGRCPPGGKEMTLGEEKELEKIKAGLTYVSADKHSGSPHWDTAYPWKGDPATLPDNRHAVEATFLNTERRLNKEPEWKAAYKEQIHEMVSRGAATKLTKEEIDNWKGPVWYISHLVALNPHSTTTPVRIVWNSSQEFKGVSLNNILHKGPDVLNQIRGVLLRFRAGKYAALGDVKKMYNSVWLKDTEVHLHRFLWRDNQEDDIGVYAVVRVNIGDKPAGCIAQVAMRETTNLPQFITMIEERRVVVEDCYVDDVLTSHNDFKKRKKREKITKGVEEVLKAGGFFLKPWVSSGQSGRPLTKSENCGDKDTATKTVVLPNRIGEIQKAGSVDDWRWVEGSLNVADIITRGATPEELDEQSVWQQGPTFLKQPESEWPVKMVSEIVANAATEIKKLQRRAFSAAITKSQPEISLQARKTWAVVLVRLVNPERFSNLSRLCATVAWVHRAAETWLSLKHSDRQKWEASRPKLSVEYLTPNSFILGRTGQTGDMHGVDLGKHPWRRLRAVQAGVDKFWTKWSELAGPNLFVRHKWHRTERSVKIGDVVWIADQNAMRGQFRLGRVVATYPDKKGIVRDADVKACVSLPAPLGSRVRKKGSDLPAIIIIRRDVRRLVVLIPVDNQTEPAEEDKSLPWVPQNCV